MRGTGVLSARGAERISKYNNVLWNGRKLGGFICFLRGRWAVEEEINSGDILFYSSLFVAYVV